MVILIIVSVILRVEKINYFINDVVVKYNDYEFIIPKYTKIELIFEKNGKSYTNNKFKYKDENNLTMLKHSKFKINKDTKLIYPDNDNLNIFAENGTKLSISEFKSNNNTVIILNEDIEVELIEDSEGSFLISNNNISKYIGIAISILIILFPSNIIVCYIFFYKFSGRTNMIEFNFNNNFEKLNIFNTTNECLIRGVLENKIGKLYVNSTEVPSYLFAIVGDYVYTFGSLPNCSDVDLVNDFLYNYCRGNIIMPADEIWEDWFLKNLNNEHTVETRYFLKKFAENFNEKLLESFFNSLDEKYSIKKNESNEYDALISEKWSFDFVGHFRSKEDFLENGVGFCVYHEDKIVGACSSYGYCSQYKSFEKMVDIIVATRDAYRKQGIGKAVCAKFILYCLENNIYPNWDAGNMNSLKLSEKLGYVFDRDFKTFILK